MLLPTTKRRFLFLSQKPLKEGFNASVLIKITAQKKRDSFVSLIEPLQRFNLLFSGDSHV
ncbi:hypothetical protein (plasmid) [Vibrio vulnificus YJ016]|uniref:Uncharacterized protein n=1 Tax=Vibrio vulnificus (strain YJ016) TaxID=196600 RepID=Q7MBM0_VIBVY|nr:hypothetical protein [Vibrio vulnificus YJ016]